MATSKNDWKQFFSFEKELLNYLSQQKILAGKKDELCYQQSEYKNSILERPPKFLHAVISLQGNADVIKKVEADVEELKSLYLAVSGKPNFPSRFPKFLTPTPLQINLSQHDAYRSHVVPSEKLGLGDYIQIKRYGTSEQIRQVNEDVVALENIGIKTELIPYKSSGKLLTVSINDLIRFSNAARLSIREHSGVQYTSRVRYPGSYTSVRMSYSLLVVRDDCTVIDSLPQGPRSHRFDITKKLEMPIECDADIFIKEA